MKLLEGRTTQKTLMGGVGGMVTAATGTVDYFELAGHRFDKPRVTFSQSKVGPLSTPFLAGNIGQDLLLPFTVVLDYTHYRIAFVPLPSSSQ